MRREDISVGIGRSEMDEKDAGSPDMPLERLYYLDSPGIEEGEGGRMLQTSSPSPSSSPLTAAAAATYPAPSHGHAFSTSLEGLRGLAVLFTLTSHVLQGYDLFREIMGMMGVTIFFVLSGYLITGVLTRLQDDGCKSPFQRWRRFHSDRAIRLLPALLLMVALTTGLRVAFGGDDMQFQPSYSLLALFSLSNFPKLWPRQGWGGPFANTWTLSCEEQFYLIWSLLLPVIFRSSRRRRTLLLSLLTAASFAIRLYTGFYRPTFTYGLDWHYGLLSNVWKILLGTTLSLCPPADLRWTPVGRGRAGSGTGSSGRVGAYVCLASLCALPFVAHYLGTLYFPSPPFPHPKFEDATANVTALTDPLSALLAWLLVAWLMQGEEGEEVIRRGSGEVQNQPRRLGILELPMLRYAGRISYAWYLWQFPLWALNGYRRGYSAIGDTCIAFVAASVSTFYVEEPIRKRYKEYQRRKRGSRSASAIDRTTYAPVPTIIVHP